MTVFKNTSITSLDALQIRRDLEKIYPLNSLYSMKKYVSATIPYTESFIRNIPNEVKLTYPKNRNGKTSLILNTQWIDRLDISKLSVYEKADLALRMEGIDKEIRYGFMTLFILDKESRADLSVEDCSESEIQVINDWVTSFYNRDVKTNVSDIYKHILGIQNNLTSWYSE